MNAPEETNPPQNWEEACERMADQANAEVDDSAAWDRKFQEMADEANAENPPSAVKRLDDHLEN